MRPVVCALLFVFCLAASVSAHQEGHDPNPAPFVQSSDEVINIVYPDKQHKFPPVQASAFGPIGSASRQPVGVLTGRIVFMNAGHGWMYDPGFSPPWRVMRPSPLNEMNEDYGNVDQLNFLANYCFNAGAVVVPFRPIGHQTNEVVLDNDSANVSWAGTWSDSSDSIYFGAAGDVPYRFASFAATESATATYTPNIPKAGYYPVYCWTRHGSNRGDQLYKIRHTGGESQISIPHYMVGNGWVYLGEYYFNAGSNSLNGAVVISNLRSTAQGSVVIADAIRFGNGMGSVVRGGTVSGYPREDECARYWVEAGIALNQTNTLYNGGSGTDDESDSWHTPPRMSAEMNNPSVVSNMFRRVHIGFHSNATTGNPSTATARGSLTLVEANNPTPNQARLAKLVATEVENDLIALGSPPLEVGWNSRSAQTTSGGYTEISNNYFNDEMDATILEVAFHDNTNDAKLLCDSKARAIVARGVLHGIIRYMNEFDANPLAYLPEPPTNVRALGNTNGNITLNWTAPVNFGGSQAATNYVIYRSTNGFGFGNAVSVGNVTSYTVTNLAPNIDYYFQVAAANAGGESMPSEVVGCRAVTTNFIAKILYVNAFDRFDRTLNLRQDTARGSWDPPGPTGGITRVWPRNINAFNYVVAHGKAIAAYGAAFDSCQNEAVSAGTVVLTNYPIVIWAAGQESTSDETFSSAEQTKVSAFINAGGHLFTSGSEIGWDLDKASGPTAADRTFYNTYLHADFGSDTNDDSNIYTVTAVSGGIFNGRSSATFDDGTKGFYWVQFPDIVRPFGANVTPALYYNGTTNAAALQYNGGTGGRVVYFGFPFETITSTARQNNYMADIINFFTPAKIVTQPVAKTVNEGTNVSFSVVAGGHTPLSYQWRFNGTDISGETLPSLTLSNVQGSNSGNYSVVVTNSSGSVTSSVVALTVIVPPSITSQPQGGSVIESSNFTFSVSASGSAPFNYQWRFNDDPIIGATASSYTLTNTQVSAAGEYSVIVSNAAGLAISSNATLAVIIPVQFTSSTIVSNELKLLLSGEVGVNYTIQASSNLVEWVDVTNFLSTQSTFEFSDGLTNDQRYYRVLKQ